MKREINSSSRRHAHIVARELGGRDARNMARVIRFSGYKHEPISYKERRRYALLIARWLDVTYVTAYHFVARIADGYGRWPAI